MTTQDMRDMLKGAAANMSAISSEVNERWKGKDIKLLKGKYAGREAVIDSVFFYGGQFYVHPRIPKLTGEGELNDHPDARRGYEPDEVELL